MSCFCFVLFVLGFVVVVVCFVFILLGGGASLGLIPDDVY